MAGPRTQRRVALVAMLADRAFDGVVSGILAYAEHAEHWHFAGEPYWPFVRLGDLASERVDGVIGNFHNPRWLEVILETGVTTVNTSTNQSDAPLPRVGHDEMAIGRLGAEHLLACGFGEYGFVGAPEYWFSQRRLEGFAGVIDDAGCTCHVSPAMRYQDEEPGERLTEWLAAVPKPIGVMAFVDYFGAKVIEAAQTLGLRVPEDVAVLGLGNESRTTVMTRPPMSSINIDRWQVGYRAAQMLDELMAGEAPPTPQWVPPIGVVTRRSTDTTVYEDPAVVTAMAYIRDHCTAGLTVDDVLERVEVSRKTLETRMKRATGLTPQNAIYRAQLDRAKQMLLSSQASLGRVAGACGFARQDQFCTVFKRLTGMTPGQFRQQALRR